MRQYYAAGICLREIARKMNVPEGTVLARAKREGWTQQIAAAKQAVAILVSSTPPLFLRRAAPLVNSAPFALSDARNA